MPERPRQLALDLPVATAFGSDDFLVGPANATAVAMIEAWPDWPDQLIVLGGPPGSGKSHLAAIWAERAGGTRAAASSVSADRVPDLARHPALALEDLDGGVGDERALFHLVNLARERGRPLLVTTGRPVAECGLRTPDLVSRLRLAPSLALAPPDDAMLKAVLVKLFHDRQLPVETAVVDYLATRIERSFAAAAAIVDRLDRETLARGRRVTRPMAAELLAFAGEAGDHHASVTTDT